MVMTAVYGAMKNTTRGILVRWVPRISCKKRWGRRLVERFGSGTGARGRQGVLYGQAEDGEETEDVSRPGLRRRDFRHALDSYMHGFRCGEDLCRVGYYCYQSTLWHSPNNDA